MDSEEATQMAARFDSIRKQANSMSPRIGFLKTEILRLASIAEKLNKATNRAERRAAEKAREQLAAYEAERFELIAKFDTLQNEYDRLSAVVDKLVEEAS